MIYGLVRLIIQHGLSFVLQTGFYHFVYSSSSYISLFFLSIFNISSSNVFNIAFIHPFLVLFSVCSLSNDALPCIFHIVFAVFVIHLTVYEFIFPFFLLLALIFIRIKYFWCVSIFHYYYYYLLFAFCCSQHHDVCFCVHIKRFKYCIETNMRKIGGFGDNLM